MINRVRQENEFFDSLMEKYRDYTMVPPQTFQLNLSIAEKIKITQGSIVECGVWRGGMIAAIAEVLGKEREYFLFDSFEGLPEAKEIDGKRAIKWQNDKESPYYYDNAKAEIEFAQRAMTLSGAKNVQFIKGWFSESLAKYDGQQQIALLRIDCDWYDSVMACLDKLFPLVVPGGIIIIDDYFSWDGCSIATHDFLSRHRLPNRIIGHEHQLAYIIK